MLVGKLQQLAAEPCCIPANNKSSLGSSAINPALGWGGQTNCGQQEIPPDTQHNISTLIHWELNPWSSPSPWLTMPDERRIAQDLFSITLIINLNVPLTFPKGTEILEGGSGAWAAPSPMAPAGSWDAHSAPHCPAHTGVVWIFSAHLLTKSIASKTKQHVGWGWIVLRSSDFKKIVIKQYQRAKK